MCQRAMIDHPTVVTPADDFVLIHDHAADRHFSERPASSALADRRFHIFLFPCQFCCHLFFPPFKFIRFQQQTSLSQFPDKFDPLPTKHLKAFDPCPSYPEKLSFVKSSPKGSTGFYVKFKSVYQYPNRLSRGGWRVERTKRSKPNIAAIYFSLFP